MFVLFDQYSFAQTDGQENQKSSYYLPAPKSTKTL